MANRQRPVAGNHRDQGRNRAIGIEEASKAANQKEPKAVASSRATGVAAMPVVNHRATGHHNKTKTPISNHVRPSSRGRTNRPGQHSHKEKRGHSNQKNQEAQDQTDPTGRTGTGREVTRTMRQSRSKPLRNQQN